MNHKQDQLENAMSALRTPQWDREDHMDALDRQLMNDSSATRGGTPLRRHSLLIAIIAICLAGTGLAATYVVMNSANQYKFEVRHNGEVIGYAQVLVKKGQTASVTVGTDTESFTIDIAWDGTTSIRGMDGLEYDVEIIEVPIE